MNQTTINCSHINQKKLAERWNISQRTLEHWRAIDWGPLFLKIGNPIVYWVEDILIYEEKHLSDSIRSRACD